MKDKIKIDKGVPVPESKDGRGKGTLYPFKEMKLGDSFFIPNGRSSNLSSSFLYWKAKIPHLKNLNIKTKTLIENGQKGIRVWLVK